MVEDLKIRSHQDQSDPNLHLHISSEKETRAKQMRILDLERNILQAKGNTYFYLATYLSILFFYPFIRSDPNLIV